MTPTQKTLVQQTFLHLIPMAGQAAQMFYGRLFQLDPSLRPLFKSDLTEQGKKLMQMIGACVSKLDEPEELIAAARELGRKHVGYGVKEKDYQTVGEALLWTLEKGLGTAFTPAVKDAWAVVYGALASAMKEGALSAAA